MICTVLFVCGRDAKEYGSILIVDRYDWDLLDRFVSNIEVIGQMSMYTVGVDDTAEELKQMIAQGRSLAQRYHVTITNPPYFNSSRFSEKLLAYVYDHYPLSKSDLAMIMYDQAISNLSLKHGFIAFMGEAAGKEKELLEAYEFGKALV